ncbi:uncharacterized protein TNCT_711061 [Trichonephila clavata]|uniref:Uncharacterized protein n=1 Tax=Trichonephila clavata TaxID=2740835 RepID=A0A8X6GTL9_TRICU|nr:uncharacterized protein TNCT_711061 [Trichonephila clavata]
MGSKMESPPPTERPVVSNLLTTTARQICTAEEALMTLWVRIAGIKRHKNVGVLLDYDSQQSYISESLVSKLGLPIVPKENIALTLFSGYRIEPKLYNKYRVKLCSTSSREYSNLEFEFLDQYVICEDIHRVFKCSILKELKRNNIWLSDRGGGRLPQNRQTYW